jgi:uncharacterized cofD-like protein
MNALAETKKYPIPRHWRPATFRPPIERLVEAVLSFTIAPAGPPRLRHLAEQVLHFDPSPTRVVILGGGTGLSTVVGGNSQMPDWPEHPFVGLKQDFKNLDVVVCTTDDGGSTGRLLRCLPMIAIGDLRKSCLSLMRAEYLRRTYGTSEEHSRQIARVIQRIFNYRFSARAPYQPVLSNPLLSIPAALRRLCPEPLANALVSLGEYISPQGSGPVINPAGHSLGNLIMTSALFKAARGRTTRPPGLRDIRSGLDYIASLIGSSPGRLHAATATPGQLKVRYANGVEVYGQSKSSTSRRGSPVETVSVEFAGEPIVGAAVCRAIRQADLIIYAPGSLYTSIMPLLHLPEISAAIRDNRTALKILGANSWVQEGETDISLRQEGRGFLVSELIEAYDRNIPGGAHGLFDVVLSANLEQIPSNILRNYALEGKTPIHLDRARVESMGFLPVEASLLSPEYVQLALVIHHDARKFTLAVRTLLWARTHMEDLKLSGDAVGGTREHTGVTPATPVRQGTPLCEYIAKVGAAIEKKSFRPERLRETVLDLAWENRDIHPGHLKAFRGARIVPQRDWHRSNAWDNVLGYFDPEQQLLLLHERLAGNKEQLRQNLLIALGESLLGRYIEERHWIKGESLGAGPARCYEIQLRPASERDCYLNDAQLRTYLGLARMVPDANDRTRYRIVLNDDEGFLPPGLLFGMMYAWYLNNTYGKMMEYEMSLLRFPPESLIPHQQKERARKQALVDFFREIVFGHARDDRERPSVC